MGSDVGVPADPAVAAGAAGTLQAQVRRLSTDLATLSTTADAIKTAAELLDNAVSGASLLMAPWEALQEAVQASLIADAETVDVDEFGPSVSISLAGGRSGELLSFAVSHTLTGSGALNTDLAGELWFFDADPSISAGDADASAAAHDALIARVPILNSAAVALTSGVSVSVLGAPVPFHTISALYVAFRSTGATSYNSVALQGEIVKLNAWYRRDS